MEAIRRQSHPIRSVLVAGGLSIAGVLAAVLLTGPFPLVDPQIAEAPTEASLLVVAAMLSLNFIAFGLVAAVYLWWTDRSWDYLDLEVPSVQEWLITVGAIAAALGFVFAVGIVTTLLEIESPPNEILRFAEDPTAVLVLIAIVFLFNAPMEELLFRNVVQKRLYPAMSRVAAVVVASVIFALVHVPSYAMAAGGGLAEPHEIAVPLIAVFGGSLVFGYVYARTDNLVVAIVAHMGVNAIQLGLLLLGLLLAPEELEGAAAAVVSVVASA